MNPEILNLKIQIQASENASGDKNSDAEIENSDPDENASESEFMQILMKIHQMNMQMKFHHLMQIKIHASEIESGDENSS